MVNLIIKSGDNESSVYPLAHLEIAAILSPRTEDYTVVNIWGSFDGKNFGPIFKNNTPIVITVGPEPILNVYDASDFAGIMFMKLVASSLKSKISEEELKFSLYLIESR